MSLEIYQFADPVIFANHALEQRQLANPRFSLRGWARQLGYNSPSYLAQVLKRQRKFKIDLAKKIALNLKMRPSDQRYLEALVLLQNCKTTEERNAFGSREKNGGSALFRNFHGEPRELRGQQWEPTAPMPH